MKAKNASRQKSRLSSLADLEHAGLIDDANSLNAVADHYDIGVSDHLVNLMRSTSQSEALKAQYIPDMRELDLHAAEQNDPIGDEPNSPIKGIVHRYPDRVLLKITHLCAVYCRFCFRREMIGKAHNDERMSEQDIQNALDYIAGNKDIYEVILTGGDPLSLSARQLAPVFEALENMDHVKVIRIHSRVPIADPKRIGSELISILPRSKSLYIALHINHASEISNDVRRATRELRMAGAILLSQSVLLRGINDDPHILEILFRELTGVGIKPYYIHHPDLARGTSHFRISLKRGRMIMRQLLGQLSGICHPTYMLDIPGGHGKVPVSDDYIRTLGDGRYEITDYQGHKHFYEDAL